MNHTPGPWKYDDIWALIKGAKGEEVAAIHSGQNDGARVNRKIAESNAQLIAAAPETAAERDKLKAVNAALLEALESAWVSTVNGNPIPQNVRNAMVQAIQQAKGESTP